MNKGLQDKVWASLPKEFLEEVKELYAKFRNEKPHSDCSYGYLGLLISLFGEHNLTSDAEGEKITDTIDWEQRMYELTKELMKGFAANPNENVVGRSIDTLAEWSVCGADEIIKRLQEKNK